MNAGAVLPAVFGSHDAESKAKGRERKEGETGLMGGCVRGCGRKGQTEREG